MKFWSFLSNPDKWIRGHVRRGLKHALFGDVIAEYNGNILTIHQTIPINGVASLTLSVDVLPTTGDTSAMLETIEKLQGIHYLKILARE